MDDHSTGSTGLNCDGDLVVVDLRQYQFPNRCLLSGQPVEGEHVPIVFYAWAISPSEVDVGARDAIKSTWSMGLLWITGIAMRVPMSSPLPKRSSLPGISLLVLGILISLVGSILTLVGFIFWQWPWSLLALPIVVGSALTIAGTIFFVRKNRPLRARKFLDGFVWLAGVHPALIATLPPWRDSPVAKAHRKRVGLGRLGMGGLSLLIGTGYFIYQYQDVIDSILSFRWLSTQGAITSSEIVTSSDSEGKNSPTRIEYVVQVNYTFRAAAVEYSGSRMRMGKPRGYATRRLAVDHQNRYCALGTPITVFYYPRDPSRCALERATWTDVLFLSGPILISFVAGVGGLISGGAILLENRTLASLPITRT